MWDSPFAIHSPDKWLCRAHLLTSSDWQEEPCLKKLAFVTKPRGENVPQLGNLVTNSVSIHL